MIAARGRCAPNRSRLCAGRCVVHCLWYAQRVLKRGTKILRAMNRGERKRRRTGMMSARYGWMNWGGKISDSDSRSCLQK